MRELLNTLYVQSQGALVRLDHDAVQAAERMSHQSVSPCVA